MPLVALIVQDGVNIREIPEYALYNRQARNANTTTPDRLLEPMGELVQAEFPPTFGHLSSTILCKEKPADGNIYGHLYCWSMIILFILLIGSLIIYQLRSIFWFKANINGINSNTNSHQNIELGSLAYGRRTN